jgi:hypothetical protein
MAIDTREKRQNAVGVARSYMRHPLPVGATDQQSRIARGHGYGGNEIAAPAALTIDLIYIADGHIPTYRPHGHIPTYQPDGHVPRYKVKCR